MRKEKPLVKNSLFISWLLSYVSVLLVPLIISGVIYYFAVDIIANETMRANTALLAHLQETIDSKLDEIERMGIQIAFNARVNDALRINGSLKASDRFNMMKLGQDLDVYRNTSDILDYIYIYFINSHAAISKGMLTDDIELFHKVNKQDFILGFEEWKELMQQPHHKEYMIIEDSFDRQEAKRSIVYLQSLSVFSSTDHKATMVQVFKKDTLLGIAENVRWVNQGTAAILDKQDHVIASTQPIDLSASVTYKNMTKDQDVIYVTISEEKYAVSYVSSKINNWKYILLMPTYVFWEKVEYIRMFIFISIILCVILGGVATYVFTKRNYSPIQKIVQALIKEDILSFESKYEEYGFIRKAIYDTLVEKNKIAKTLEKKDDILKNSNLVRFMKTNNESYEYVREIFASYGIDPENRYFSVIVLYINPSHISAAGEKQEKTDESTDLNQFIISNVVSEMINRAHFGLMVDMGDMLSCVICFENPDGNDYSEEIYRILTDGKQFINKNFDFSFTASAGSMHMGMKGIGKSYKEALDALDAQMFVNRDGIVFYDDISYLSGSYHYSVTIEHRIANMVETGDYDGAYALLQEIFNKSFESESFSVEIVKCLMFDIVGTFIKVSDTISDINFMEEIEPFKRLTACTSVTQMKEEVVLMLRLVCKHAKQNMKETNVDLSMKVIEYINSNYYNTNLNVNMIADYFNITPSYLSRLFRIQKKEKLVDTINRIRIEKSKQLLKSDKFSISQISEMIGYSSSSVFIKSFKKHEGITPGQFKEII